MADADYGYVGAGPGRVSLYKGKTCIQRNLPAEEAVERLLQFIESDQQHS
jgi:(E)-4-hydroxy-3-methylbut-2-enyl-diphosphate synthase